MAIGSSFASGLRQPQNESYLPMIQYLNQKYGARRGGIGGRGPSTIGTGLSERMRDPAANARWSAENELRSRNAGRLPTMMDIESQRKQAEQDKIAAEQSFELEKLDRTQGLEREKMAFGEKERKFQRGITLREQNRADTESGIKKSEEKRASEKHGVEMEANAIALEKEKRTEDHIQMMQAFMMKDPIAVTTYFVKHGPKDKDGAQKIPFFEVDEQGNWSVEWPGSGKAMPMSEQALSRILQSLSPKYEYPKSEMERANIEKAKKGGGIKAIDMEKARQTHAKNISENTAMLPEDDGRVSYEDAYRRTGGIFAQPQQASDDRRVIMQLMQQASKELGPGATFEQIKQRARQIYNTGR